MLIGLNRTPSMAVAVTDNRQDVNLKGSMQPRGDGDISDVDDENKNEATGDEIDDEENKDVAGELQSPTGERLSSGMHESALKQPIPLSSPQEVPEIDLGGDSVVLKPFTLDNQDDQGSGSKADLGY